MKNTTYFTILVFLFLGCFAIGPLIDMQDWIPIITLVWIILGYSSFKANASGIPTFVKYFTIIIICSVLISFISASNNYNVDFFSSLLTNRQMLLYLAVPLIFRLDISDGQIFKILKYLFLIPFVCKVIELTAGINPLHGSNNYITSDNLQDFGIFIEGMPFWTFLAYFFVCQWFENVRDKKKLVYALMGGICVIITFNRSMTIPFLALTFFFYLKRKNKTGWLSGVLVLGAVLFIMWPVLQSMMLETQQQAGDEDYARNAAIQHFLVDSTPGLFEQIFGNSMVGTSNAAGAALLEFRKSNLFSLVDLGWIGFYFQYGIFPIIVYLCLIIQIIRSQTSPSYVKMMAIHLLFPIGWNMWMSQYMLISVLLIYLYYYYQKHPYDAQYLSKI